MELTEMTMSLIMVMSGTLLGLVVKQVLTSAVSDYAKQLVQYRERYIQHIIMTVFLMLVSTGVIGALVYIVLYVTAVHLPPLMLIVIGVIFSTLGLDVLVIWLNIRVSHKGVSEVANKLTRKLLMSIGVVSFWEIHDKDDDIFVENGSLKAPDLTGRVHLRNRPGITEVGETIDVIDQPLDDDVDGCTDCPDYDTCDGTVCQYDSEVDSDTAVDGYN